LARPHLLVQHLLKQLETHAQEREQRDPRPAWLVELVEAAAAAFAPLSGVARVGSECEPSGEGWEARFYVGATELVGGKDDGQFRQSSFELNLAGLAERFTQLHEFRWNVASGPDCGSFVTIRGLVDGQYPVCLKAYSRTPEHLGPALRQYHDGRIESVG